MKRIKRLSDDLSFYEKRLLVLLFFATIPCAFMFLQPLVTLYTPAYHCEVHLPFGNYTKEGNDSLANNSIHSDEDSLDSCYIYKISLININRNKSGKAKANNQRKTIPCKEFKFSGAETSLITEYQLICDKSWEKPFATLMYMIGMLVGCCFTGIISDRFGRKKAFFCVQTLQFSSFFVMTFVQNMWQYRLMAFLAGATSLSAYQAITILSNELSSPKQRYVINSTSNLGLSIGAMIFALLSYLIRDWRWCIRVTGILGIFYIPYFWLLDETPRWLLANEKREEAVKVLDKVAKMNKQPRKSIQDIAKLMLTEKAEQEGVLKTFVNIIQKPTMLGRLLIICFAWFVFRMIVLIRGWFSYFLQLGYFTAKCSNMKLQFIISKNYFIFNVCFRFVVSGASFTIWFNTNNLSGDRFLNMFFLSLAGILGSLLFTFFSKCKGASTITIAAMVLTSLMIGLSSWLNTVPGSGAGITLLAVISNTLLNVSWITIYILTVELFPTNARHTFIGICSFWARIGGFCAPYIVHAGENGSTIAPSLGNSVVLLVSALTILFLPDTHNRKLPQTVEEALNMKRSKIFKTCKKKAVNLDCTDETKEKKSTF